MENRLFGSATHVGIVREKNQDVVYAAANKFKNYIGLVCDGLGGYEGGAIAAAIIRDWFAEAFKKTDFNNLNAKSIKDWFAKNLRESKIQINSYVQQHNAEFKIANNGSTLEQMASTIVLSLIVGKVLYTFWVGDSRAYILNSAKESWQITKDHNLFNYLTDNNASSLAFKAHANELLALTNIISKEYNSKNKDEFGISIQKPHEHEHYLLLCSDGFYNFVPPENFYDLISASANDLNNAASELLKIGMHNLSNDNLSVVIMNLSGVLNV